MQHPGKPEALPSPSNSRLDRRRLALVVGISLLLCAPAVVLLLKTALQRPSPFQLIDITGAEYARSFSLPDQNGVVRTLEDFRGEVAVVFFGFTQCPDVCPTTMTEIAEAKKMMGAQGKRLRAVFVTLDPERDTPQVLKAYLANFDPDAIGLRPSPQQLPSVTSEFKIYAKKNPGTTPASYTLDHTAASYVYDPQGRLRLYARYGTGAAALAADAQRLLGGA